MKITYIFIPLIFAAFIVACTTQTSTTDTQTPPANPPPVTTPPTPPVVTTPPVETPPTPPPTTPPSDTTPPPVPPVKEFTITAQKFSFTPSTITVKQGDKVRLKITSIDVNHGFAIDEYGISETLLPNQPVTVEFTADKKGTFTFYCNIPCGPGHRSMKGTLTVE